MRLLIGCADFALGRGSGAHQLLRGWDVDLAVAPTRSRWLAHGVWVMSGYSSPAGVCWRCRGLLGPEAAARAPPSRHRNGLVQLGKPIVGDVPSTAILWFEGLTSLRERGGSQARCSVSEDGDCDQDSLTSPGASSQGCHTASLSALGRTGRIRKSHPWLYHGTYGTGQSGCKPGVWGHGRGFPCGFRPFGWMMGAREGKDRPRPQTGFLGGQTAGNESMRRLGRGPFHLLPK